MSKEYDDLISKININDELTVYYKENNNDSENVNIDLIQIERNGIVLLEKKEFKKKESALIYIGLIAGFFSIGYSIYYLKKKTSLLKKEKKKLNKKTAVNSGLSP